MLTLCCSTPDPPDRLDPDVSLVEDEGALTVAETPDGLGACSMRAQEGEVLVDVASREQLAAPGLGRLPPALLPESSSNPT